MDETLAEGHVSLAMIKIFNDWDWPGAETELQRAMQLNPNLLWAHLIYARYWQAMGRLDRAVAEMKRAQELDPLICEAFLFVVLRFLSVPASTTRPSNSSKWLWISTRSPGPYL